VVITTNSWINQNINYSRL